MDAIFAYFYPMGSVEKALSGFEKEFAALKAQEYPSATAEKFKELIDRVTKYVREETSSDSLQNPQIFDRIFSLQQKLSAKFEEKIKKVADSRCVISLKSKPITPVASEPYSDNCKYDVRGEFDQLIIQEYLDKKPDPFGIIGFNIISNELLRSIKEKDKSRIFAIVDHFPIGLIGEILPLLPNKGSLDIDSISESEMTATRQFVKQNIINLESTQMDDLRDIVSKYSGPPFLRGEFCYKKFLRPVIKTEESEEFLRSLFSWVGQDPKERKEIGKKIKNFWENPQEARGVLCLNLQNGDVPEWLFNHPISQQHLMHLTISGFGVQTLSKNIKNLLSLSDLKIKNTSIKIFPEHFSSLSIFHLEVDKKLKNEELLKLHENGLTSLVIYNQECIDWDPPTLSQLVMVIHVKVSREAEAIEICERLESLIKQPEVDSEGAIVDFFIGENFITEPNQFVGRQLWF
jgi:hypothetical protein